MTFKLGFTIMCIFYMLIQIFAFTKVMVNENFSGKDMYLYVLLTVFSLATIIAMII